jgi:hypothetical protein
MELLLASFDGTLQQALIIGSIVGAFAGILMFAATSAAERTNYVIIGALAGGLLVAIYQGLQLAGFWGIDLFSGQTTGEAGELMWTSVWRIAGAALGGGLLVLIFVAPARSFLGGLGGVVVGAIASVLLWLTLSTIGQTLPVVIYGLAVFAVMLFLFETISRA